MIDFVTVQTTVAFELYMDEPAGGSSLEDLNTRILVFREKLIEIYGCNPAILRVVEHPFWILNPVADQPVNLVKPRSYFLNCHV
jgi:hypothetical protein